MSYGPVSRGPVVLFTASDDSTVRISNAVLVADWRQITVSLQTQGPGSHSLQATNYDGFQTSLASGNFSTISSVAAAGLFTIDPGMRWLRWIRPATDSLATVIIAGRT